MNNLTKSSIKYHGIIAIYLLTFLNLFNYVITHAKKTTVFKSNYEVAVRSRNKLKVIIITH